METAQRVVHRSALFSRLLWGLVILALLLFGYTALRENLPQRLTHQWPWKIKLLDFQSATAAVIATVGAALARAQYARTVRPALGHFGRAMAGVAPNDQLAWTCHFFNGGQDVAVITEVNYWLTFTPSARAEGASDSTDWGTSREVAAAIETRGLTAREDFSLELLGAGHPIPPEGLMFLGWFAEPAMREVETIFVKVRVVDRVGDTHERVVDLLKGVNRSPRHPDPPPF
ncbi:hypothetical protein [Streptomyces sp. NPDC005752]|uniref:hypothetical protein n=1 Tax=Streptomyces sp. NPDC005752 TaxID=3157065 RepID=UPI0033EC0B3A